jgi:uncharacterized protein (TIGR00255 family)
MTGFGEARRETPAASVQVEIRSVNNRFLKTSARLPDSHASLEREMEKVVREKIRRGTVTIAVRLHRAGADGYRIDRKVLEGYLAQLKGLSTDPAALIGPLLALPGVVSDAPELGSPVDDWPLIAAALHEAFVPFEKMRREEGEAMCRELRHACQEIASGVARMEERVPHAVAGYRDRLQERINSLIAEYGLSIEPAELVREVAVYAERADIAEEIARLRSHLEQFEAALCQSDGVGRRLEFLGQEMHRESNTIGSKAIDVEIAKLAVDLKGHVEKIREIVQNIE